MSKPKPPNITSTAIRKPGRLDVLLYIPNIIGFLRVIFALLSIICMAKYQHFEAMLFYFISSLMDAFDGVAARHFNQCSQFGSVFDMITDRSATSMLLCSLCHHYSACWMPFFQVILSLDLSSHYMRLVSIPRYFFCRVVNSLHSTSKSGSDSHKNVSSNSSVLLKAYYTQRPVLFAVCALNELFLAALYVLVVLPPAYSKYIPIILLVISSPVFVFKQIVHVIQLVEASNVLLDIDIKS